MDKKYIDIGEGEVILFLHGWGASAELYMPLLKHLSKSFRVLAPDLPGFGGTDEPDTPWSTDEYVKFAQDFLHERGISKCTLIGHSHGGRMMFNWLSADDQPFEINKAVICAGAGLKPKRGLKYYLKVYTYKALKCLPLGKLKERYIRKTGSSDYAAASPMMRKVLTRVVNEDYTGVLHKIKQSTLLVWGDMDTATPIAHGQTCEKLMPDAGLVTLNGGTHYAILEQIHVFLRVLEVFLSE